MCWRNETFLKPSELPLHNRNHNHVRPILVTGGHRSGSTWAGQMIAAAPGVGYIPEPFNPGFSISPNPKPFRIWFQHIPAEYTGEFVEIFQQIIQYNYPFRRNIGLIDTSTDAMRVFGGQIQSTMNHILGKRPLIKDPIAIFSAEWLYKTFDMDVICMIRHPAAFCSSLKVKSWDFSFTNFLSQELLMEKYLAPYQSKIEEYCGTKKNIVEQGILLWNCVHHTISIYQENHPDWLYMRHEDLSADPVKEFRAVYEYLDLPYTKRAIRIIQDSSGAHNPAEAAKGHEHKRNSLKNIRNWKQRLTEDEVRLIRDGTGDVANSYYNDSDW